MDTYMRQGLTFDVEDRGPARADAVVLLHGFPQTNLSWAGVADRLVLAGYRTLAPNQRGYASGARIAGRRNYRLPELVADTTALIEAADAGPVHLVGHDWGATVAWMVAAHRPELVRTVTGVSVPHPGAYLKSMLTSRQGLRSWYMVALQVPVLPEWLFGRPGMVQRFMERSGQSPEDAARDATAVTGNYSGPINWYRGLPLSSPRMQRRKVTRPALQVWGDEDAFVSRAAVEANPDFMTARYRLEIVRGTGHWLPDRAPDQVAALIDEHICQSSA